MFKSNVPQVLVWLKSVLIEIDYQALFSLCPV